jgi:CRP/FNR family transcriptional regulator, cyclic AMP receptor protein
MREATGSPFILSAMVTTAEVLGKIELFRGLSPKGLERVAAIASEESHAAGETLFREGDPGDRLYVVVEGKTRISRQVAGMGEEALAVLGAGSSFGEMALIDEVPRSADAIVHERCKLLVISKEALQDLMFLDKELAYEVLWNTVRILSRRLRETNDKMTFMSMSSKF